LEPFKISEMVESTNFFLKFDEFNQFLIKFSDFENSDGPNLDSTKHFFETFQKNRAGS
jgi:hypothetical protein